jgi:hypothetical protein
MKILVTGSRKYSKDKFLVIYDILDEYLDKVSLIIQGEADGADEAAKEWARMNYIACLGVPANWPKYGKRAGTLRNEEMLKRSKPDLVVAFPLENSVGTWHMIKIAEQSGVKTRIIKGD